MKILPISEEEKTKLVSIMKRTMELGIGAVYGQEDEKAPDAVVDCTTRLAWCRSVCCTFSFALTKDEVKRGFIKHDRRQPFFVAREQDAYCPHLERGTFRCSIWSERPLRCRQYDCTDDPDVRPEKIEELIKSACNRLRQR
jgi:Fe-S-cluster containining protein